MLLRRVLGRRLVRVSIETEVLRRVLRRGGGVLEKALRRQKHALSQSTTPFACTLLPETRFWLFSMERKKPIKKSHIKEFGGRMPPEASQGQTRDVPGTHSDIWARLMCKSILNGQNVPGTDGTYHGTDGTCPWTDGTHTRGCPAKILYVYWFFSFPIFRGSARTSRVLPRRLFDFSNRGSFWLV